MVLPQAHAPEGGYIQWAGNQVKDKCEGDRTGFYFFFSFSFSFG